jgi:hypothetical protein
MAAPLGVLPTDLTAATTEVKGDIDGGPPRVCCRWVRQRTSLMLKEMSKAAPCGVMPAGPSMATNEDVEDVDGGPPGRCYR